MDEELQRSLDHSLFKRQMSKALACALVAGIVFGKRACKID